MEWYQFTPKELEGRLETDQKNGLTQKEAENRLEKYGENKLREVSKKSMGQKIKDQLLDPMVIILIIAAILSAITSDFVESIIIIAIVILNACLSIYQEGKAEDSVAALKKMSAPAATVVRGGQVKKVESTKLVPGDLVLLETGDIVPADLRLTGSSNLKIDESSFTGESLAVSKEADTVYQEGQERGIGDRENYSYSSTIVTYGKGRGLVTATGHDTEIGKIANTIQAYDEEKTPLQKKLDKLSGQISKIIIVIAVAVFVLGLLAHNEILSIFMTAISLAVAAIPEGLTAVVTIVLSMGMNRMAKRNAIVKRLLSVETLGTTTAICSDKTGTLTQNEMTVTKIYSNRQELDVTGVGYSPDGQVLKDGKPIQADSSKNLKVLMAIGASCNDAQLIEDKGSYDIVGDPTEGALLTMAAKAGMPADQVQEKYPRLADIPFDSSRKMMTVFSKDFFPGKVASFTKGAPDVVLSQCKYILLDGEVKELTPELKEEALKKNKELASQALRCLAYAYRVWDDLPDRSKRLPAYVEREMVFVGISGMIDPPREEVKDAIAECKRAGITTYMITGDYLETALAIGQDLGIAKDKSQAIMGSELNDMSQEEVQEIVKEKRIFARVSPQNKVQIVDALKANGEIAAMTGDGVNDAPAIKRADIGIAMGITGTDVAKNTADVILTDDNFATIVGAVEEGRIIYSNIRKFVNFLLSCNIGEVIVISAAMVIDIIMMASGTGLNFPIPLSPIMLLWLNLVTDSLPALALGVEAGEEENMERPPRDPSEPIIDKDMKQAIIVQSIAISVVTLLAFTFGYFWFGAGVTGAAKLAEGRTMAFATLILAELFRAMAVRSERHTMKEIGWFTNKAMNGAILVGVALLLFILYVPIMRELFDASFMTWKEWIPTLILSLVPFLATEIYEAIHSR